MARTDYINLRDGTPAFDLSRWPKNGTKVKFLARNGYEYQLEQAQKVFNTSDTYVIKDCVVGMSSSTYEFESVPGTWNTVMFETIDV